MINFVDHMIMWLNSNDNSYDITIKSKKFEILIKGGTSEVRIFERSKGKLKSIFLQRDELVWLVDIVKEVVAKAGNWTRDTRTRHEHDMRNSG
jgi:hypothetical protein